MIIKLNSLSVVKVAQALLVASSLFCAFGAHAQASKNTVRILVGFPAGGGVDAVARHLADGMSTALGQPVVVENRTGAGGQIAAQALKGAAPDGNTLFLSNDHTVVTIPLTTKNPGFNPAKDFTPIANVANVAFAIAVHPSIKVTKMADLSAWVHQNPGKANVGVPASASLPEFTVGLLNKALNMDAVAVAYRGGAPMVVDLIGGQVPIGITSVSELLPYQKADKIRVLAVSGQARTPLLPDVPTFTELSIKGLEQSNFLAFFAPAGTPPAVVIRYNELLRTLLASASIQEKVEGLGMQPAHSSPEELSQKLQRTTDNWATVIKQSGFKPQ
ncbi:MAG: Bug family tripartite tricarboxylate transporter substrate binding protein [Polaromonas sp.]